MLLMFTVTVIQVILRAYQNMNWILFGVAALLVTEYFSNKYLIYISDIFQRTWDLSTDGAKLGF